MPTPQKQMSNEKRYREREGEFQKKIKKKIKQTEPKQNTKTGNAV